MCVRDLRTSLRISFHQTADIRRLVRSLLVRYNSHGKLPIRGPEEERRESEDNLVHLPAAYFINGYH